jgi:hypothetical protein
MRKIKEMGPYSQSFIFVITYEWPNKQVLNYTSLEKLARDKYSGFLGPFIRYKK